MQETDFHQIAHGIQNVLNGRKGQSNRQTFCRVTARNQRQRQSKPERDIDFGQGRDPADRHLTDIGRLNNAADDHRVFHVPHDHADDQTVDQRLAHDIHAKPA